MSKKEITSMHTKSFCFINGDSSLMKNSDSNNIFLSGFDSRGFLTYKFGSLLLNPDWQLLLILV